MSAVLPNGTVSADALREVEALAELLAEVVVVLAGETTVFPSHLQEVAELAQGHDSVRRVLSNRCDEGDHPPGVVTW